MYFDVDGPEQIDNNDREEYVNFIE